MSAVSGGTVERTSKGRILKKRGYPGVGAPQALAHVVEYEHRVLELIARRDHASDVFHLLVESIEKNLAGASVSIGLLNAEGTGFSEVYGPSLDAGYRELALSTPIVPGCGSCSEAMLHARQVIVPDMAESRLWEPVLSAVEPFGFRACWSTPILDSDERVIGCFATYFKEVREPSENDLLIIRRAAYLASIAAENRSRDELLRHHEEEAKAVMDSSPDLIIRCDAGLRIRYANRAVLKVLGKSIDVDPWYPETAEQLKASFETAAKIKKTVSVEIDIGLEPGRIYDVRVVPEFDGSGTLENYLCIARDVTALKAKESDLAANVALTEGLLQHLPSGVMLLDEDGTVVLVNHAARKLLKLPLNAEGRLLTELAPNAMSLLKPGFRLDADIVVPGLGARSFGYANVSFRNLDRDLSLVLFQDVTEIRALREELRRQQRMGLLGRFVATIAHEIKNPLFGITSLAELLLDRYGKGSDDELFTALVREAHRMQILLEDLLRFGKSRPLNQISLRPWEIIREVVHFHASAFAEKGIVVKLIPHDDNIQVVADADRLRQIVRNLLLNALNAGGDQVEIGTSEDEKFVIWVEDNGRGMTDQVFEQLFQPFSDKATGSGLGLWVSKNLAEEHGGELKAVRQQAGSRFEIHLPTESSTT